MLFHAAALLGGLAMPMTAAAEPKTGGTTTTCSICITKTDAKGVETTNCFDVACDKIRIEKASVPGGGCSDTAGHKGVLLKPGVCKLAPYPNARLPAGVATHAP